MKRPFIFTMLLALLSVFASCEKEPVTLSIADGLTETAWTVSYDGSEARTWDWRDDGTLMVGDPGDFAREVYTYAFTSGMTLDLQLVGMETEGVYAPDAIPCCHYSLALDPLPDGYMEGVMQAERAGSQHVHLIFKRR